ncbi:hypothetical protein BsWGS_22317 [Bradybaena similaris]
MLVVSEFGGKLML